MLFTVCHSSGSNSQPIWLDNVQCSNSYSSCLSTCEQCPYSEYHNCVHSEDVTLECGNAQIKINISSYIITSETQYLINVTIGTCNSNSPYISQGKYIIIIIVVAILSNYSYY